MQFFSSIGRFDAQFVVALIEQMDASVSAIFRGSDQRFSADLHCTLAPSSRQGTVPRSLVSALRTTGPRDRLGTVEGTPPPANGA